MRSRMIVRIASWSIFPTCIYWRLCPSWAILGFVKPTMRQPRFILLSTRTETCFLAFSRPSTLLYSSCRKNGANHGKPFTEFHKSCSALIWPIMAHTVGSWWLEPRHLWCSNRLGHLISLFHFCISSSCALPATEMELLREAQAALCHLKLRHVEALAIESVP